MHQVKLLLHFAIHFHSFTIFPSFPAHWSCVNWRLRWRPASWRMMYRMCTHVHFVYILHPWLWLQFPPLPRSLARAIWMPPSSIGLPWYRCCVGCKIWPQFAARGIKVQLSWSKKKGKGIISNMQRMLPLRKHLRKWELRSGHIAWATRETQLVGAALGNSTTNSFHIFLSELLVQSDAKFAAKLHVNTPWLFPFASAHVLRLLWHLPSRQNPSKTIDLRGLPIPTAMTIGSANAFTLLQYFQIYPCSQCLLSYCIQDKPHFLDQKLKVDGFMSQPISSASGQEQQQKNLRSSNKHPNKETAKMTTTTTTATASNTSEIPLPLPPNGAMVVEACLGYEVVQLPWEVRWVL